MNSKELAAELAGYNGTDVWYRHPLNRKVLYTAGVQCLAEKAGAYWLLDEVALAQTLPAIKAEEFQLWRLKRAGRAGATLTMASDIGVPPIYTKQIQFTDFPLDKEFSFYCIAGGDVPGGMVILLKDEY